jgi:hypothetical protein
MIQKSGRKRKRQLIGRIRAPIARPTRWHKDKSKYTRKRKHKDG